MREVATPGVRTIADLATFMKQPASRLLKTLVVEGADGGLVALLPARRPRAERAQGAEAARGREAAAHGGRGAHRARCSAASPVSWARSGSGIPVIVDHSAAQLADFVCGANKADAHLAGVNWGRDLPEPAVADLRNVVDGDPSPAGPGRLSIARGIEVGHIFQLGQKYSEAMRATVQDEQGRDLVMYMGCYGIGVTRIVAAAIEQNHDERGIIWPAPLTPFDVVLVGLNWEKSAAVRERALALYRELGEAGIDVLLDDRDARPGVKFADAELVGIPHRVVVSERGLASGRARIPASPRRGQRGIRGRGGASSSCAAGSPPAEDRTPMRTPARHLARGRPACRPRARGTRGSPEGAGAAAGHRGRDQGNAPATPPSTTTSSGSR